MAITKGVYDTVKRQRKGVSVKEIEEKTGFTHRQVANVVYRLTKEGRLERTARGVYSVPKKAAA